MYIINQLKSALSSMIFLPMIWEVSSWFQNEQITEKKWNNEWIKEQEKTPEQLKIDELKVQLDTLKASKQVVGWREKILREWLLKDWDPVDKEYQELALKVQNLQKEFSQLNVKEKDVTDQLTTMLNDIGTQREKLKGGKWDNVANESDLKENTEKGADLKESDLKDISNKEFLNIPEWQRLQYITKDKVSSEKVASWQANNLDFTFTFEWKYNKELYLKTTAWQVLPKEVWEVIVWWKTYTRNNVWWEFFSPENVRLVIREGTKLDIWDLRTPEDLENLAKQNNSKVTEFLSANPNANKEIVAWAISRWIDPKFANLAFTDLINWKDPKEQKVILEDAFTEFDRQRWHIEAPSELVDWKYEDALWMWLLEHFSPDKWKEKSKEYWFSDEKIKSYSDVSNTKIDFSSLESWDTAWMIDKTAQSLWVDKKLIKAILMQESSGNMSATRFEKHVYYKEIRKWTSPEEAKLLSTSFWWFQIMWFNYKACWYNNVKDFVEAMKTPANQFDAFAKFIKSNKSLYAAMKNQNFEKIAYYYNWPNYAQNNYDNAIRQKFNLA